MQDPSLSHGRPLFGCFAGTFSPSRRQMRSTRLWFTYPALAAEQRRDPAIAVATVRAGQPHNGRGQRRLIVSLDTPIALRRAWLPNDPAHPTLGQGMPCGDVLNIAPAALGA